MNPTTRTLAPLLALVLHGGVWAGPVGSDAPEAATAAVGAAAATQADPVLAPMGSAGRGLGEAGRAADAAAASAPSASALVLEMLTEADAAAGHEAVPPPQRSSAAAASAAAPGLPAATKPALDDDPFGLRDLGKAAVRWAKSVVPWLGDDEPAEAGKAVVLDAAEWSGALPGGGGLHGTAPLTGAGSHAPAQPELVYREVQSAPSAHAEYNVVREIIELLRLVLEHPLTWLVAALIAIGAIVVKRIDRRPTK